LPVAITLRGFGLVTLYEPGILHMGCTAIEIHVFCCFSRWAVRSTMEGQPPPYYAMPVGQQQQPVYQQQPYQAGQPVMYQQQQPMYQQQPVPQPGVVQYQQYPQTGGASAPNMPGEVLSAGHYTNVELADAVHEDRELLPHEITNRVLLPPPGMLSVLARCSRCYCHCRSEALWQHGSQDLSDYQSLVHLVLW
jgi:hypothetical protein